MAPFLLENVTPVPTCDILALDVSRAVWGQYMKHKCLIALLGFIQNKSLEIPSPMLLITRFLLNQRKPANRALRIGKALTVC